MIRLSGYFYQFTGMHAFLTGLIPFYLPVILWRETGSLALISGFISLSGVGFLACLMLWENIRNSRYSKMVIAGSFMAEAVLISLLVSEELTMGIGVWGASVLALINGAYGCFYWLTLRALFIKQPKDGREQKTGNRFGNFQLVVGILLKIGILVGAFLLEAKLDIWLVLLTLATAGVGITNVFSSRNHDSIAFSLSGSAVSFKQIARFNPGNFSRSVFFLDGLFLFLESYFWVLSLYVLSNQSFSRLGVIVVGLAVILSLLFLAIKRHIDAADSRRVFILAVGLYSLSWVLRGFADEGMTSTTLSVFIISIAFMTSFFRLAFNKLFFDRIEPEQAQLFILAKSWFTQTGVTVFFGVLALVFWAQGSHPDVIKYVYWISALLAIPYLFYIRQTFSLFGLRIPFLQLNAFTGKQQ
ncbi:hypothetical protein [Parendozoicomonas sp. Alg238-R29]|uniref:hypothetical protein n=1 Tax=Parendozoicomonas sp. Alg238-R29 TaxID=2993446 RepID=UPI00248E970D|nr:hypothetical protein [Parendozoicomonas sp. Alg238-R29]